MPWSAKDAKLDACDEIVAKSPSAELRKLAQKYIDAQSNG